MAKPASTATSRDAKLNREDLHRVVSNVDPQDTPIYSSIVKGRCRNTRLEWGVDELDGVTDNAQVEGDEWSFVKPDTGDRVHNYTQILWKPFAFSGTQEAVDSAGNDAKTARELINKMVELRKDVEASILLSNPSAKGADAAARKSGSLNSWLTSNVSMGENGMNGGFQQSGGSAGLVTAPMVGTQRAFSKTLLDGVMTSVYSSGGNPSRVFVSPYVKTKFAEFLSDANTVDQRREAPARRGVTINASVEAYLDPQGQLVTVMPDRVMVASKKTDTIAALNTDAKAIAQNKKMARNAYVVDRKRLEWCWLRSMRRVPMSEVAQTGDSKKTVVLGEGTLRVANEKAHGVVRDVNGLSASG